MMGLIAFLLVSILVLLCVPIERRASALGRLVLFGILLWLLKTIHVVKGFFSVALGLIELGWQHRVQVFISLGVLFFVWLLGYFAYCAARDQIDNWALRKEWKESKGTVRVHLDRRIEQLVGLGYDRDRAQAAAMAVAMASNKKEEIGR